MNLGRCGVYRIVSPSGNCYVGSSIDMPRRWRQHASALRLGKHHSPFLQAAARKHGVESMRFEPIACALTAADLLPLEQSMLTEMRPQYNASDFATGHMRDPRVVAKVQGTKARSTRNRIALKANQALASKAVSKAVVRLTDGVVFPSGYAAALAHGEASPDNLSTAIRRGWKFAGHFWAFHGSEITLEQRVAASNAVESARKAKAADAASRARSRPIRRSIDGRVFPSSRAAASATGVHFKTIHQALKTGCRAAGSYWAYAEGAVA